jgi:hypothetical protein
MRSQLAGRVRRCTVPVAVGVLFAGVLLGPSAAHAATQPLSISIVHNHFVNAAGHTIRLLGVNHPSAEYGCVDGFGYDDGHFDAADATAVASWGADAVRIPSTRTAGSGSTASRTATRARCRR